MTMDVTASNLGVPLRGMRWDGRVLAVDADAGTPLSLYLVGVRFVDWPPRDDGHYARDFPFAPGGDARMLLIRESFASGMIGVVFLLSLALPRPLIFYLARATVAREAEGGAEEFEQVWNEHPALRRNLRLMTGIWGAGLTVEMLLRCGLAWYMSVERVLGVGPIVSYAIYGLLIAWTFWFRGRMRESAETA